MTVKMMRLEFEKLYIFNQPIFVPNMKVLII